MAAKKVDFKVVMLGRASAGKSALVERFANDRWNPSITSTIGGSFCAKTIEVPSAAEIASGAASGSSSSSSSGGSASRNAGKGKAPAGQTVTIGIWDTAGSERYESLTRHYFNQAESAFVCFDVTDFSSWQKVSFWIAELQKIEPNCRIYIIGCKADLVAANQGTQARARVSVAQGAPAAKARGVSKDEIMSYCANLQPQAGQYFETSSLTGAGISQAFEKCAADWIVKPKPNNNKDAVRYAAIQLEELDRKSQKKGILASCCNQ